MERLAVHCCDVLTGVSKAQSEYYYHMYGKNMIYIPPGVDAEEPVAPQEIYGLGLTPNQYILYLGRLSPEKGVHYLISAFRRLDTSCRLVLVGDASGERYRKELTTLADGDERILFTGLLRGRPVEELLSNARVYVQPSELEGLSLALLEAMGYGNCCLVSDIPENLEAIGEAGWCFRNKSIESLSEQLDWLLRHPDEAIAAGKKARARVRDHYSWDEITTRFEQLYEKVLNSKAA